MSALRFEAKCEIDADAANRVDQGLTEHAAQTGLKREPFSVTARDEAGQVMGGLTATMTGRGLYIKLLWVCPSVRGQGVGAKLMADAESLARQKGCDKVYVDTISYQAPEFYVRLGYGELARIDKFIGNYDRIFFIKEL